QQNQSAGPQAESGPGALAVTDTSGSGLLEFGFDGEGSHGEAPCGLIPVIRRPADGLYNLATDYGYPDRLTQSRIVHARSAACRRPRARGRSGPDPGRPRRRPAETRYRFPRRPVAVWG